MKNSPTEVKKEETEERKRQEELEKQSVTKRTSSLAVPRMTVTQTTIPH